MHHTLIGVYELKIYREPRVIYYSQGQIGEREKEPKPNRDGLLRSLPRGSGTHVYAFPHPS